MAWSQLPAVALAKVISYLPLRDQLCARRVCKYWRLVNDSFVPRRELILFCKIHPRPVYWQRDHRAADPANGLMANRFLCREFFWTYFRKIQRLMVVFPVNCFCKPLLKFIQASFTDLQHLQFTSVGNWVHFRLQKQSQTEFRLENLRTLYSYAPDMPLNLNCPKLAELFVFSNLTIDERTNEQTKMCLRNLKLLRVYLLIYPPGFEFSNLQILHIVNLPISLVDFPLLKELHYSPFGLGDEVHAKELLQQKEQLKREDLRIFFQGFDLEVKNYTEIEFRHLRIEGEDFRGLNFNAEVLRLAKESLSSCNFSLDRKTLDLRDSSDDELAGLKEGELPKCLFRSITDLFIRKLTKVSPAFFKISHKFPYIHSVSIDSEVSQALLDRLPDVLPLLASFTYRPRFFRNHRVNFEFVARFKSLNVFFTCNRLIAIYEFQRILESCEVLEKAIFSQPPSGGRGYFLCIYAYLDPSKSERKIYGLNWRIDTASEDIDKHENEIDFARTSFDREELFKYLQASRWIRKIQF